MCLASVGAKALVVASIFALSAVPFAGCEILGGSVQHFTIRVDSIALPSVIAPGDTLKARFFGSVGPDGCWDLEGIDRHVSASALEVRFRGSRTSGLCTQMPVHLDHIEAVPPPLQTPFTVAARQPDGSALQRVVVIR